MNSTPKPARPKRWYLVMYMCIILSFWVFIAAPRIGYPAEASHTCAILIGLWAPILAVFGLRAELSAQRDAALPEKKEKE